MTFRDKSFAAAKKRAATRLGRILRTLESFYGKPRPPEVTDPLEQILFENVAYLATDARRAEAFRLLSELTELKPDRILGASRAALRDVGGKGILPANTAEELQEIAAIALEEFGGDLSEVLRRPPREAIKALRSSPRSAAPAPRRFSSSRALFPCSPSSPTACAFSCASGSERRTRATAVPTVPRRRPQPASFRETAMS